MNDDRTENFDLPLPHPQNTLRDDVTRIRESFQKLDEAAGANVESLTALGGIVTTQGESIAKLDDTLTTVMQTTAGVTIPGTQRLYPHENGEGVVMEYTELGAPQKLFIAGAKHRGSAPFGTYGLNMPEFAKSLGAMYVEDKVHDYNIRPLPTMTDAIIDTKFAATISYKTAREMCDIWMQYAHYVDTHGIVGVPAVQMCRNITSISGFENGLDLPTMNQLLRIFINAERIDALDPTAELYPHKKLGRSNPNVFWRVQNDWFWSCNSYSPHLTRTQYYDGTLNNNSKNLTSNVLAVCEMTA